MTGDRLEPGDMLLVHLPGHVPPGHEQEGVRLAVVLGVPPEPVRFGVVLVAPATTRAGQWARRNPLLYPRLPAGAGGLRRPSTILLDQVRALDLQRTVEYLGTLAPTELEMIRRGLRALLNL
ncbi:type II toxin-antitoxin system PemK/MazF family toxin [Kyrpidia tusciae]|uniref:Transcriptional modulator of MazE/toxin, MazF n=1 Tax=Kyrpidia tusciae (strain DSM 2912 / NBRC 15312 / T2) TaxID=562970 RepID=D5WW27_KYRT2|nr:type II toxin-antitoxin system PemK/MazF family toxin [Kyrpidia tusciae]ADG05659.1 transcriptional modulator of MazE/toxin, MazF [Kyrpidia tusciae DSM 2912]